MRSIHAPAGNVLDYNSYRDFPVTCTWNELHQLHPNNRELPDRQRSAIVSFPPSPRDSSGEVKRQTMTRVRRTSALGPRAGIVIARQRETHGTGTEDRFGKRSEREETRPKQRARGIPIRATESCVVPKSVRLSGQPQQPIATRRDYWRSCPQYRTTRHRHRLKLTLLNL